jgi:hypothetical protein
VIFPEIKVLNCIERNVLSPSKTWLVLLLSNKFLS